MPKTDYVLNCGQKDNNIIDDEVTLYDKVEDVQGKAYQITFDNKTMYAKYGELNDPKASLISVNIDGVEKALLRQARFVWDFRDVKLRYKEGSVSVGGDSLSMYGKFNPNDGVATDAELQFDVSFPQGAKNIVVKWDWQTNNYPFVDMDWFDKTLSLANGDEKSGHFERSIPDGISNWDNRVRVGSYDAGIFSKGWIVRNFKIEFDLDVPIVKNEMIDDFGSNRRLKIQDTGGVVDVINNTCRLRINPGDTRAYIKYAIIESNPYYEGFDQTFNWDVISISPGAGLSLDVEYLMDGKTLNAGSSSVGSKTIKVSPGIRYATLTLKTSNGAPATSIVDCVIDNVKKIGYWT